MRKRFLLRTALYGITVSLAFGPAAAMAEDSITLRTVSGWPESNDLVLPLFEFKEMIEERTSGQVTIEYVGGPETIPSFEQAEAVRNGIVDMALSTSSYYASAMPEAYAMDFSELTAQEERETGAYDYLVDLHRDKVGVHYLGRTPGRQYAIYTIDEVRRTSDLEGMNIRATAVYSSLLEALGASYTTIPGSETYTALERGVVDGVSWPNVGVTDLGFDDHVRYQLTPYFWQTGTGIIMNPRVWDRMSPELQQTFNEVMMEIEHRSVEIMTEVIKVERAALQKSGVEIVELEDSDYFTATANRAAWEWFAERAPERSEEMEAMFRQ